MSLLLVRSYYTADTLMVGLASRWELACCSIDGHVNLCVGRLTDINRGQRIRFESISRAIPKDVDNDSPVPEWLDHVGDVEYSENGRMWGRSDYQGFPILIMIALPPNSHYTNPPPVKIESWFISPRDWQLMLLLAILPALSLARFFRTRARIAKGGCVACGYNLTGNASGACPECGTRITK
jgi:hypothetical protein